MQHCFCSLQLLDFLHGLPQALREEARILEKHEPAPGHMYGALHPHLHYVSEAYDAGR